MLPLDNQGTKGPVSGDFARRSQHHPEPDDRSGEDQAQHDHVLEGNDRHQPQRQGGAETDPLRTGTVPAPQTTAGNLTTDNNHASHQTYSPAFVLPVTSCFITGR